MMFPLITVGIVVLNRDWIIERMLASLHSQTYPHNKIFVLMVDGGSTDRTVDIAKKFLENSDFYGYKIIVEKCSIPEGRNLCIKNMKGDFLLFWDSDVLMEPEAMRLFIETMRKEKADIVTANAHFIFVSRTDEIESKIDISRTCFTDSCILEVPNCGMGHTLISKKVFDAVRFDPDLTIAEDLDFSVKSRMRGFKIIMDKRIRVFDVNVIKKDYSDIHIDMPLKNAVRGIRKKAKAHVLAYSFKINLKGMLKFFLKNKRYIFYLGYAPMAFLSALGIFYHSLYLSITLPVYLLAFLALQIKKRGLRKGLNSTLRSLLVGFPFSLCLAYYFIKETMHR